MPIADLRQAVLWIAFDNVPMPHDYERAHNVPLELRDQLYFKPEDPPMLVEYQTKINKAKNHLYLALKEGRIKALGQRSAPDSIHRDNEGELVICETYDQSLEFPKGFDLEEINSKVWNMNSINWNLNLITFNSVHLLSSLDWDLEIWGEDDYLGYAEIEIKTEELMRVFPKEENSNETSKKRASNSGGRPNKYDWTEFYEQAAVYLAGKDIKNCPDQQSIFNDTMSKWCAKNWGDSHPATHHLHPKLKKIYEAWFSAKQKIQ